MPAGLGYSFDPGAGQAGQQDQGERGNFGGLSPQQAVKLLSLRIPERPAASAIAPQALLQSQGAAGMPMNAMIQQLMRAFMPGLQAGAAAGGPPSPRVIPGLNSGEGPYQPDLSVNTQAQPSAPSLVPPNLDELLARYREMVPTGGFTGGLFGPGTSPQPTASAPSAPPSAAAYLQSKMSPDMLEPLF